MWAMDGPQSKTPSTGTALANSLVVVFVIEFVVALGYEPQNPPGRPEGLSWLQSVFVGPPPRHSPMKMPTKLIPHFRTIGTSRRRITSTVCPIRPPVKALAAVVRTPSF